MTGALFHPDAAGKAELMMDLNQGNADIGVISGRGLVLVPMMMDSKVFAISTR